MNDLYKLNILLKEMHCMAKEVDYLLCKLSRNEDYRGAFDSWYSLFDVEFIRDMKEYTDSMIEERKR